VDTSPEFESAPLLEDKPPPMPFRVRSGSAIPSGPTIQRAVSRRRWSPMPEDDQGRRHPGQGGQADVEYALLIALGAVLVIVGLLFLAGRIDNLFSDTGNAPGTLTPPVAACDPHYVGGCVPPPPPDLDCADLQALGVPVPVTITGGDPHGLDPDGDGLGC
jgi:Flp pilus assembly pilin Flp